MGKYVSLTFNVTLVSQRLPGTLRVVLWSFPPSHPRIA